jgi:hypothetical protein
MWLTINVEDAVQNGATPLATINSGAAQQLSFDEACTAHASTLAQQHNKIFCALSGGLDSEYVLRKLVQVGANVTPIIVLDLFPFNEAQYAFHACRQLGLTPKVIPATGVMALQPGYTVDWKIHWGSVVAQKIAIQVAEMNGATYVSGEGDLVPHGRGATLIQPLGNDFSCVLYGESFAGRLFGSVSHPDPFFLGTPEIAKSYLLEIDHSLPVQEAKSKLYNLPFRAKIRPSAHLTLETATKAAFTLGKRTEVIAQL